MASIREKRPGYWEVRVLVGEDDAGRPVQVSESVKGGRRDAERLAVQLAGRPQARSGSLTVGGLLDDYLDFKGPSWSLTTRRDYAARADPTTTVRTHAQALEGLDGAIAETLADVLDGGEAG